MSAWAIIEALIWIVVIFPVGVFLLLRGIEQKEPVDGIGLMLGGVLMIGLCFERVVY